MGESKHKTYYIDLPDIKPDAKVTAYGEAIAVNEFEAVLADKTEETVEAKGNGKFAAIFLIATCAAALVLGVFLEIVRIDGEGKTAFAGLLEFFDGKRLDLSRADIPHSQTTLMYLLPTLCMLLYASGGLSVVFGLFSLTGRGTNAAAKVASFVALAAAIGVLLTPFIEKVYITQLTGNFAVCLPVIFGTVGALSSKRVGAF
jgi:hypothetical protein